MLKLDHGFPTRRSDHDELSKRGTPDPKSPKTCTRDICEISPDYLVLINPQRNIRDPLLHGFITQHPSRGGLGLTASEHRPCFPPCSLGCTGGLSYLPME